MAKGNDSPMRIQLSAERREEILRKLTEMYSQELDEELSLFRAEQVLQFFIKNLGPSIYNQAIQDARGFMLGSLADLDATFYEKDEIGRQQVGKASSYS